MSYNMGTITLGGLTPSSGQMGMVDEITHLSGKGITLRIVPANGGIIVAIKDETALSSNSDLYVISEADDLGKEIGKILTMHLLKKE